MVPETAASGKSRFPFCPVPPFLFVSLLIASGLFAAESPDFSRLDARIGEWVGQGLYPGAAMIVEWKGRRVHERYWGSYEKERDRTVESVASAGKWVAAATFLTVVESGVLSLDEPASNRLPLFRGRKGLVTPRQMFSHTSGLPPYYSNHVDDWPTLAESVAELNAYDLVLPPGSRFQYGGMAMQVAGRMAEAATGLSWEEIFQRGLAKPLGMDRSHFMPVDRTPGFQPMLAGGFRTTPGDMMRFLKAMQEEGRAPSGRVLSAASVAEIEADQLRGASIEGSWGPLRSNAVTGVYGLGCWREETNAEGRATIVSSPGWAGVYPWIDRVRDLRGVFMAHIDGRGAAAYKKKNGVSFDSFRTTYRTIPKLVEEAVDGR